MSEIPQANTQPVFSIEKIYVKDLSLEIPNAPAVFLEREQPAVDIQLHHNSTAIGLDSSVHPVNCLPPGNTRLTATSETS